MTDTAMAHLNPWRDDEGFIFLQNVRHSILQRDGTYVHQSIDLYAIEAPETVHFGARFSDEGSDYESGEWMRGSDTLYVGRWTAQAAALYFLRKMQEAA